MPKVAHGFNYKKIAHLLLILTVHSNPSPPFDLSISSLNMCLCTPLTKATVAASPYCGVCSTPYYEWSHDWGIVHVTMDVTLSVTWL